MEVKSPCTHWDDVTKAALCWANRIREIQKMKFQTEGADEDVWPLWDKQIKDLENDFKNVVLSFANAIHNT